VIYKIIDHNKGFMYFLQEAMAAGPYLLIVGIIVLIVICIVIYIFLQILKNNEKIKVIKLNSEENISELKNKRTLQFFLFTILAVIILGLWKFFSSLGSIKFD
jgi:Na+/H+ antiporter NhaD/arsenite permease-like protein